MDEPAQQYEGAVGYFFAADLTKMSWSGSSGGDPIDSITWANFCVVISRFKLPSGFNVIRFASQMTKFLTEQAGLILLLACCMHWIIAER
mmetsp:Transcript_22014/g.47887  ORF Transcript_22014/g.47887 Transcript_22014/m.47887 type:complete len:90 (+) Transcript_22014:97-366(+)